ncbi:poly(A) polymerase [Devosia enhydra]|uniref:Poly(A) polymerase n=1 Tax=Devosia enhydra TaxID=665118 RepID=A0A1K2HWI0_9HYPH|nr:CCA tRNA nucleotidyltransferase [Devosia enhydra]SFZ83131.1 poly(A) polymerase [Devosia enhydra]
MPGSAEARLAAAPWLRSAETQALFRVLDGEDKRTRAVGGIVRDTILDLGRPVSDLDLATELLPEEVLARAEANGIAAYPTGIDHGTVTLRLGDTVAEVTTLREDVETDGRHARVRFGQDWARDAARRDFTLNALYCDRDGRLFDPLGGLDDCRAGRVRFIGDPERRIAEDRLRILRFFRFSASHGGETFDAEGLAACRHAARQLASVSAERIGHEMRRMLALPRIAITLRAMAESGVLPLPDATLAYLHAYERRVFRPDIQARLALILADERPEAIKSQWRLSNDEIDAGLAVLAAARLLADFRLHEAAYRQPGSLADGLDVAATLAGWSNAGRQAVLDQLGAISVPSLPVNGRDLMALGYRTGPALGAELARLERLWLESGFALGREALLEDVVPPGA